MARFGGKAASNMKGRYSWDLIAFVDERKVMVQVRSGSANTLASNSRGHISIRDEARAPSAFPTRTISLAKLDRLENSDLEELV